MALRRFYFYHYSKNISDQEMIHVWLPAVAEAKQMMDHIRKKTPGAEIHVEKQLMEVIDGKIFEAATPRSSKKIILYAQSDTLANSATKAGKGLSGHEILYMVPKKSTEKAEAFFQSNKIAYRPYSYKALKSFHPDVFLLLNDWSKEAQRIIAHCHLLKIPVICLQESVIDFGDHVRRMQRADEVFVQGSQTVIDLARRNYYVTGNPRYESQLIKDKPGGHVLINSNFTYGIFEDQRDLWLQDIHDTLVSQNLDYVISQHPRDTGDLSRYKKVISSSSASITDQLNSTRFLITRFSSLIHEALVAGIPVIYYNPHGEKMQYDFEFDGKILQLAENTAQLEECVKNISSLVVDPKYLNEYLAKHCICRNSLPSNNIHYIISTTQFKSPGLTGADLIKILLYHPFIKGLLSNLKKLVKP